MHIVYFQVVTWSIDQKTEDDLCKELRRIGVSFKIWEEKGDDKLNIKVKKWSQPNGKIWQSIITIFVCNFSDDNKWLCWLYDLF